MPCRRATWLSILTTAYWSSEAEAVIMSIFRTAREASLAAAVAAAAGLGVAGSGAGQNYPVKPIPLLVPFPPGGPAHVNPPHPPPPAPAHPRPTLVHQKARGR